MIRLKISFLYVAIMISYLSISQDNVSIVISPAEGRMEISPYIYGRNNSLSDNPGKPLSSSDWLTIKDAGVTFFRESGGNNCTKYNWKKKLGSHPDWYNNVYAHDWDYAVQSLQDNVPKAQGMWSFQLLGKVAKTNEYNFNDWEYNNSQWWDGVTQNLAGGGIANESGGSQAIQDGDIDLYLQDWPADSTVAILDHWFGDGGLGIDANKVMYWNMDNEVEIWSGTHDDVMQNQISAEEFMQIYFEVAKKARAKYPEIKLVGPVTANEWQWYNWDNDAISYKGSQYCWLEYFILRVAEEQELSGIRLLDVLDIHFYPSSSSPDDILQYHRVYFDRNYEFPEANGVKRVNGGWDNTINKEYIFGRCSDWLNEYMGENHDVKLAVSETGVNTNDANVAAVWYASTIGEFMKNGVEFFTPWTWKKGMWEVLHLFSRYNLPVCVRSNSSDEKSVSAYSSVSLDNDSITIVLVNRSTTNTKQISVDLSGFKFSSSTIEGYKLEDLPVAETFKSNTDNALGDISVGTDANHFSITMQPLSIVSVQAKIEEALGIKDIDTQPVVQIYPNPAYTGSELQIKIDRIKEITGINILNIDGEIIKRITNIDNFKDVITLDLDYENFTTGFFILEVKYKEFKSYQKFLVLSDK